MCSKTNFYVWGFFLHQQEILWHQLGTLQLLNSETMYLETASDPAGEGLSPIRLPHSTSDAIYKQVCASDWLALNQKSPRPLPQVWLICNSDSQNLGESREEISETG